MFSRKFSSLLFFFFHVVTYAVFMYAVVVGSRPSDHYFRSVCLFVCLSVCLFMQKFFLAVFDPI